MFTCNLDSGNGNLKALLTEDKKILYTIYKPNLGIKKTLKTIFEEFLDKFGDLTINAIGITGAGRHHINSFLPGTVKTEILCQYRAIRKLFPEAKSIIDIGKEDAKFIGIRDGIIDHFVLNTLCGGGVGNYIETICFRFNLTLEEFDRLALQADNPVAISSKCAVFGMSSALNYLHKGEETKNIVAGVLRAVVRNFLFMVRGKPIKAPCVFTGGGALLKALKKAFEEELGFEVTVPESPIFTGAYGASLYAENNKILTLEKILALCYT